MSLYDPVLAQRPELARRRSIVRTVLAIAEATAALAAIAYAVPNFVALAELGRENAQDASRARYRYGGGFLPVAIILLAGGFATAAVAALFGAGTHGWARAASGTPLRKRFEGHHAMAPDSFDRLHTAFSAGDPAGYTPLPEQVKRGNAVVSIWTADADRVAYVGLSWGSARKTTRNASLIRLEGAHFDALDAALRHGLLKPLPEERNPLRSAGGVR